MAKKKAVKKKGVPEGTPLEDYLTQEMTLKELKKFAVKIGAQLKDTRTERANLEIDRDKMLRNLINVICRLFVVNREVRRLDRELINKQNISETKVLQKVNELAEVRFKQVPNFYRSKNDIFVSGYESVNQLFYKQDQIFKDCIGLNNDYYKKYLELEIAFMSNKHSSLCDKIDKVNENNLSKLLRKEKSYYRRIAEETEKENHNKAKILKEVVQKRETIIENLQKEHFFESFDILRSFEDVIKYNFTIINELREDLLNIRNRDLKVTREFTALKEKYELYCTLVKQEQKELVTIRPVVNSLHHTKAAALTYSKKMQSAEEETGNALLEIDMMKEFLRKGDECNKKLRQLVINDMLSFRQMQMKIHLFMMDLGKKIEGMYTDRVRIGKMALFSMEPDMKPLQEIYQRLECYRRSAVDLVERVMRANSSHLDSLGFQPQDLPPLSVHKAPSPPFQRKYSGLQPGLPPVFVASQRRKPPKMLELVTSLPRVPLRNTTQHVTAHMQVLKVPILSQTPG